MRFIFRVDASLQIGTGHVRRCLNLAHALRDLGAQCSFISRELPGHLIDLICKEGFETISLSMSNDCESNALDFDERELSHSHWLGCHWRVDAIQTIDELVNVGIDWLIIDHYALDHRWESMLRPLCRKIMVIDDLADRIHDCDLLLDQNLVYNFEDRYKKLVPIHCANLLGPRYALLQSFYAELHRRTPPRLGPVQRIFIYFGGSDCHNMTGLAIKAFLGLNRQDISLDVVINPSSLQVESVRNQVRGFKNITLYEGLSSLAHLMVKADLAIGASGITAWERCCLGLPTLVVTIADNQKAIAAELEHQGAIRWLGDHNTVSVSKLQHILHDVLLKQEDLHLWSAKCRDLVEGTGCAYVAELLLINPKTNLKARLATLADENLLLHWANDPIVRQNAFQSAPINKDTHKVWYYKRLRNPQSCQMYIVETDTGLPLGIVRFELNGEAWEIHYGLDSCVRGRRLAVPFMQTALQTFKKSKNDVHIFGRVKYNNYASQKVFQKLEYIAFTGEEYIVYRNR